MDVSEGVLMAGAGAVEFGLPTALNWLVRHSRRWRLQAIVILGH